MQPSVQVCDVPRPSAPQFIKLNTAQLSRRLQLRTYVGPFTATIGANENFAYVGSDIVPNDRYWVILHASAFIDNNGGAPVANMQAVLYAIKNGNGGAPNNSVNGGNFGTPYQQWPIFLSHVNGVSHPELVANGLPLDPKYAIRIDDSTVNDPGSVGESTPNEFTLLRGRVPLLLNERWQLLASNDFDNVVGGGITVNMTLKILFDEVYYNEYIDYP